MEIFGVEIGCHDLWTQYRLKSMHLLALHESEAITAFFGSVKIAPQLPVLFFIGDGIKGASLNHFYGWAKSMPEFADQFVAFKAEEIQRV